MDGYIKLNRALLDWDWHDEPKTAWLYVVMLMMANHEETRWRGETLLRGQILTGRKQLSSASGLTENEVRTALGHLRKTGDVQMETRSKYSVITLVHYDAHCSVYQQITSEITGQSPAILPADHQQVTSKITGKPPADLPGNHQQTTSRSPADHHIQELKELKKGVEARAREEPPAAWPDEEEEELLCAIENQKRAQALIARYRLNDSDPTMEALLEDAQSHGWEALEEALKTACLKDSRGGVSVNYYRAILGSGTAGKQTEDDPYAGVRVYGGS